MWSYVWTFIYCVAISVPWSVTQTTKCDDVDTSACQLLHAQRPDFCKDEALVRSICPRFCKLCPIECYHCDATYTDYHQCNTTVLCQSGEVCMKKELISFMDGHHEYEMTCQDRMICDGGSDLTIPFGKRHVNSRDISVMCCVDDLCNYPVTTTSTTTTTTTTTHKPVGCPKDIIFMVDVTSGFFVHHTAQDNKDYKDLITSVIQRLDIGTHANLVAFYLFDKDLHTKFVLRQYTDKTSIISHINSYNLFNTTTRYQSHNTTVAIHSLLGHVTYGRFGDRSSYPDAIVIIGNQLTTNNLKLSTSDKLRLQQLSRDVIVLDVGTFSASAFFHLTPRDDILATDKNHIIQTPSIHDNPGAIADQLYQLIVQC